MEYNTPLTGNNATNNFRNKIGRNEPEKIIIKLKKKNISTIKKTPNKCVVEKKEADDDMIIILTNYMKKQNLQLLKEISKLKELSIEDSNKLIEDYLKIGYYTPKLSFSG